MNTATWTANQAIHLQKLASEKGMTVGGHDLLVQKGFLSDLFEQAAKDPVSLEGLDRTKFRISIGMRLFEVVCHFEEVGVGYHLSLRDLFSGLHNERISVTDLHERAMLDTSGPSVSSFQLLKFRECIPYREFTEILHSNGYYGANVRELIALVPSLRERSGRKLGSYYLPTFILLPGASDYDVITGVKVGQGCMFYSLSLNYSGNKSVYVLARPRQL